MKKNLLHLIFALFIIMNKAQVSFEVLNTSNNGTVAPNTVINLTTSPNNNTNITFDVKNISTSTKKYIVKRYDLTLNAGANAYFCFAGNCYGPPTIISPNSLTLSPGTSASQLSGSYNMLTADLDEGPSVGQSIIKYTVANEDTPADSLQFTLHYNSPASVNELNIKNYFNIFPSVFNDNINIKSSLESKPKIEIIDITGKIVFKNEFTFANDKRKHTLQTSDLNKGIYFVKISLSNVSAVYKLIKE
ncbi:MAG: T9SS type A sorting domain-containing protein [candidate division WOR-3 bacterium]